MRDSDGSARVRLSDSIRRGESDEERRRQVTRDRPDNLVKRSGVVLHAWSRKAKDCRPRRARILNLIVVLLALASAVSFCCFVLCWLGRGLKSKAK